MKVQFSINKCAFCQEYAFDSDDVYDKEICFLTKKELVEDGTCNDFTLDNKLIEEALSDIGISKFVITEEDG